MDYTELAAEMLDRMRSRHKRHDKPLDETVQGEGFVLS